MTYDPNRIGPQHRASTRIAGYLDSMRSALILFGLAIACLATLTAFATAQPTPDPLSANQAGKQHEVDPNQLLLRAIKRAVWGKGISCQIKQETFMFDQQQIGIGKYRHSGMGEGRLELGIRFSTSRSQLYYEQISDGRLLWSRANDGQPPRRVYLDSVRKSLEPLPHNPQDDAMTTLYVAIGGQAGLLRSLYHRYRWYKIFAGYIDKQPCWEIIGTLRQQSNPPIPTTAATFDTRPLTAPVNELVPTDVRIKLIRDGELDLVPLQVEYLRVELGEKGEFKRHVPVCRIEYSDIHVNGHFDSSNFAFQDPAANPTDETPDYLKPQPVVATAPPPTAR